MAIKAVEQFLTDMAALYNGDACEVLAGLPDESVHYSIYSPPFASLYTYSNSERDLGNCRNYEEFFERALELWSNPGDVVLSPFAGIGSECYVAVKAGRRAIGVELKASYYQQACANIRAAEKEKTQATLDFAAVE